MFTMVPMNLRNCKRIVSSDDSCKDGIARIENKLEPKCSFENCLKIYPKQNSIPQTLCTQ